MSAAVFQSNHQYAKWAWGFRIASNAILDKRQSQPRLRKDGLSPCVIQNNLPGFDG
jgi:DNA-directed RNA polymerase specialized sigma24 family protein